MNKPKMTREIKFRGKQRGNGEWVEGYLLKMFGELSIMKIDDENTIYPVMPETVGQFTGLTDKSGAEIYKGDICRDSSGWDFEVVWGNDNGRFLGRHSGPKGDTYICHVGRETTVEIIGNIHDNPGLVTEQLKPCPFCGRTPQVLQRPDSLDGYFCAISCFCGGYSARAHQAASGASEAEAYAKAIEAWNRRA